MIQLYVVTENKEMASRIASELVFEKLAVAVRIDYNQHYYFLSNNEEVDDRTVHVVTGLTKSLLFNNCLEYVHTRFDKSIFVYSIPITQANETLSYVVRNSTKKV